MKVYYCSDLHVDISTKSRVIIEEFNPANFADADAYVFAGDISNDPFVTCNFFRAFLDKTSHLDMMTFFVPGNHEFYNKPIHAANNLFYDLEQDYKGRFYKLDNNVSYNYKGVYFMGDTLWTDFLLSNDRPRSMATAGYRMNDYRCIWVDFIGGDKLTPNHTEEFFHNTVKNLEMEMRTIPEGAKTVLVTHHSPTKQSIADCFKVSPFDVLNPAYASGILDEESASYNSTLAKADYWIHGHVHNNVDLLVGKTRVLSNPRGYTVCEENENVGFRYDKYFII